jgi:hypothetical protein
MTRVINVKAYFIVFASMCANGKNHSSVVGG